MRDNIRAADAEIVKLSEKTVAEPVLNVYTDLLRKAVKNQARIRSQPFTEWREKDVD